jgi:hypothetical protein
MILLPAPAYLLLPRQKPAAATVGKDDKAVLATLGVPD